MANQSILAAFERMWQHVVTALNTKADADYSHDTYMTKVDPTGTGSFSLNRQANTTVGAYSFASGYNINASGTASHAEGGSTIASGAYTHSEGLGAKAEGECAHAEGHTTTASGKYSHSEGISTIATSLAQHAQGKFNIEDAANTYAHIVGNGDSTSARSNAHTLDWNGNAWFAGDVYVGGSGQSSGTALMPKTGGKFTGNVTFLINGKEVWIAFEDEDGNATDEPYFHWYE